MDIPISPIEELFRPEPVEHLESHSLDMDVIEVMTFTTPQRFTQIKVAFTPIETWPLSMCLHCHFWGRERKRERNWRYGEEPLKFLPHFRKKSPASAL